MTLIKTIVAKTTACLVVALTVESIGSCVKFDHLFHDPFIPIKILPSFLIAFWACSMLEKNNRSLDSRCDWIDHPRKRLWAQLILGTTMTCAVTFMLVVLEFTLRKGVIITCITWLLDIGSIILTFVLLINIVLVLLTLYRKLQHADRTLKKEFPYYSNSL